ncbi:SH2 domain-containing protein 5 isoform X1 [Salmo salar]|uniref:SH2 domain-containing protein 5 isoform X1 n=2 Tax=Salmo salar TaxID=8030 RepID=A0A1S3LDG0_SALSA|nr:SH2 domain-containing protein 5-like isoform X1 [Salmo salar]|eukprot:XP_013988996.1 PREDICTED: SH2 domain-containing protein 5-like isoform X1 [Salmo salar]
MSNVYNAGCYNAICSCSTQDKSSRNSRTKKSNSGVIRMGETPVRDDGTVKRSAEYVGSFPVDDCCLDDQMQQLHTQLKSLKTCKKRRSVSLKFSIKGVKMYDEDETTILMAHALRRVSLSTAHPSDAQFAFVSHNPGNPDAQLYCHLFKASHARAAQFLNLLLCRCFQLSYLEKHPEEAQVESAGPLPNCTPSLLNQGFPLSVSALVSFRRAPTQGLLPGEKVFPLKNNSATTEEQPSIQENFITSPSLVRKKAIRNKVLRSGAYRSFTYTPHKQRHLQDRLNSPQGKGQDKMPVRRARAPSLAETEEALAQAVWCWAGITTDSSSSLLAEDVLGSYLLCPHPKRPGCDSLIIRFSSGLITHLIDNTYKGKYQLENCQQEFCTIAALIEHYTKFKEELDFPLSCARVNHCYEWEENVGKAHQSLKRKNAEYNQRKQWV